MTKYCINTTHILTRAPHYLAIYRHRFIQIQQLRQLCKISNDHATSTSTDLFGPKGKMHWHRISEILNIACLMPLSPVGKHRIY